MQHINRSKPIQNPINIKQSTSSFPQHNKQITWRVYAKRSLFGGFSMLRFNIFPSIFLVLSNFLQKFDFPNIVSLSLSLFFVYANNQHIAITDHCYNTYITWVKLSSIVCHRRQICTHPPIHTIFIIYAVQNANVIFPPFVNRIMCFTFSTRSMCTCKWVLMVRVRVRVRVQYPTIHPKYIDVLRFYFNTHPNP